VCRSYIAYCLILRLCELENLPQKIIPNIRFAKPDSKRLQELAVLYHVGHHEQDFIKISSFPRTISRGSARRKSCSFRRRHVANICGNYSLISEHLVPLTIFNKLIANHLLSDTINLQWLRPCCCTH
jgi:hypothetical protein